MNFSPVSSLAWYARGITTDARMYCRFYMHPGIPRLFDSSRLSLSLGYHSVAPLAAHASVPVYAYTSIPKGPILNTL
jgi:hypothetical protein